MSSDCRICAEVSGRADNNLFYELMGPRLGRRSLVLMESENFVVIPSLGQMVEGYLMIVPKKHFTCIGFMPSDLVKELVELRNDVSSVLTRIYRRPVFFEHGSMGERGRGGTCVSHVHLNAVPAGVDVLPDLESLLGAPLQIDSYLELIPFSSKRVPYLLYDSNGSGLYLFEFPFVFPQFFRQVLAARLGCAEKWDWREYLGLDEIERVFRRFTEVLI